MDSCYYWYNYKTKQYEYIETPTDFADYIPDIPAAHGLYSVYLKMGDVPLEAARKTLEACVPPIPNRKARQ